MKGYAWQYRHLDVDGYIVMDSEVLRDGEITFQHSLPKSQPGEEWRYNRLSLRNEVSKGLFMKVTVG